MTDRTQGRTDSDEQVRAIPLGRRRFGTTAPQHRYYSPEIARSGTVGDAGGTRPVPVSTGATAVSAPATRALPAPDAPAEKPPASEPPAAPPTPGPPQRTPRARRRHPVRRAVLALLVLLLAWAGAEVWAVRSAWAQVGRVDARPATDVARTAGHNTLMVGSDQRSGLTPEQRNKLGTGTAEGARTDTIMVLHTGSGDPTLLSIPRDSYVEIPGYGKNKINAAFAFGGPKLLVQTVEQSTGLHIDGYVEIGFAGFAGLVDSVGGVRMCLPAAIQDDKAHINLPKGCQTLDGKNALGYVRMRYSDPEGDLGRVKRQRAFLGALMSKMASPWNVVLPWRLHSMGGAAASAVAVGQDDSMRETASAMLGLRAVSGGGGTSLTVPVADAGLQTAAGTAVAWDTAKAEQLFARLRADQPVTG